MGTSRFPQPRNRMQETYANYQTSAPPTICQTSSDEDAYERKTCRLCLGEDLRGVLELTPTPPANAFVPKELLGNTEKTFPLEVVYCKSCAHLQLSHVVSPEVLFRNYVYVSGTSSIMVQHLREYAEQAIQMINLRANDFVFEFGSNDGTLLRHFKDAGITN